MRTLIGHEYEVRMIHNERRCDAMVECDCVSKLPGEPRTCCVCVGHGCSEDISERSRVAEIRAKVSEIPCEACADTGYYGDNGPGIRHNREYQLCDQCTAFERATRKAKRGR